MKLFNIFKKKGKEPIQCHNVFKLAGVTFENEDGTKRQDLIQELKEHDDLLLEKYEYNGEDAIKVMNTNKQCIGNIKAKDVPYAMPLLDTLIRGEFFDRYSFVNDEGNTIYTASVVIHYWKNPQKKD